MTPKDAVRLAIVTSLAQETFKNSFRYLELTLDTALKAHYTSNYKKLEIWGKAQRESARRPKSDWGRKIRGW